MGTDDCVSGICCSCICTPGITVVFWLAGEDMCCCELGRFDCCCGTDLAISGSCSIRTMFLALYCSSPVILFSPRSGRYTTMSPFSSLCSPLCPKPEVDQLKEDRALFTFFNIRRMCEQVWSTVMRSNKAKSLIFVIHPNKA